jgi:hypothetical protein
MHAGNPRAPKGQNPSPLYPLSASAALPGSQAKPAPDNKLSAAFTAALGKSAGGADTPPASAGRNKTKGGHGMPDQINKASKPAAGKKNFSGHRSGHR